MLCEQCTDALQRLKGFIEASDDDLQLAHHDTIPDLRELAEAGCYVCASFWNRHNEEEKAFLLETKIAKHDDINYWWKKWATELRISRYKKALSLQMRCSSGRDLPFAREAFANIASYDLPLIPDADAKGLYAHLRSIAS